MKYISGKKFHHYVHVHRVAIYHDRYMDSSLISSKREQHSSTIGTKKSFLLSRDKIAQHLYKKKIS